MKQIILIGMLCMSPILVKAQTPQLHVEGGDARIENLSGIDNRIVYADQLGNLKAGVDIAHAAVSVENHSSLVALDPDEYNLVILEGFYSPGDGGGGIFFFNTSSTKLDNKGTVVKPASVTGAGRWIRLVENELNVKWFGAKGDNVADDTGAIQSAINALEANPLGASSVAGTVYFPVGYYRLTQSLNIIDSEEFNWRRDIALKGVSHGSNGTLGTLLIYDGEGDLPMINLFSRNCLIEGLALKVSKERSITTAILIENPEGDQTVPAGNNSFKNLAISGDNGLPENFPYGSILNGVTVGDMTFGNKGLMKFESCQFEYLDEAGFFIESTDGQSKAHSFYDTGFVFNKYGIKINSGSFQTYSCSFGHLDTAIVLNQIVDNIVINDSDARLCNYFLVTEGNSNAYWPVSITAGTFELNTARTNPYIIFYHGGPLTIQNNVFSPQYNPSFRIEWGTSGGQNDKVTSMLNSFGNGFPNDNPYIPDNTSQWRLNSIGNIGYKETNSPVGLTDEFRASATGYGDLNLTTLSGISSTATPARNVRGRFRLVGTNTSASVTFDEPEIDDDYYLSITQTEFATGSGFVSVGGGVPKHVTKTTTGFTVEFHEALGFGSEGYFDWILVR